MLYLLLRSTTAALNNCLSLCRPPLHTLLQTKKKQICWRVLDSQRSKSVNDGLPQIRIVAQRRALKGDNTWRLQALEW